MKKDVAKRVKVQPVFEGTILSKARKIIDRRGVLPVYKGKPVIAIDADGEEYGAYLSENRLILAASAVRGRVPIKTAHGDKTLLPASSTVMARGTVGLTIYHRRGSSPRLTTTHPLTAWVKVGPQRVLIYRGRGAPSIFNRTLLIRFARNAYKVRTECL